MRLPMHEGQNPRPLHENAYGGKAALRTVQFLDPGTTGLAYGDPAAPLDVRDPDIVRRLPCGDGTQLVFADRASPTSGDQIAFRNLVAGAGKWSPRSREAPSAAKICSIPPAAGTCERTGPGRPPASEEARKRSAPISDGTAVFICPRIDPILP